MAAASRKSSGPVPPHASTAATMTPVSVMRTVKEEERESEEGLRRERERVELQRRWRGGRRVRKF